MRGPSPEEREGDRAGGAILLALLFLFGMEIAPAIHLGRHHLLGAHDHGGTVHVHRGGDVARERADGRAPREHGAGSLEHRAIAALTPALVVPPIDPAPVAEILELGAPRTLGGTVAIARPQARAPPAG